MDFVTGLSKDRRKMYEKEWADDCKWRKKRNIKPITLDQYINQCFGIVERAISSEVYKEPTVYRRGYQENKQIPSRSAETQVAGLKERMFYTGEQKLLGVATMHKSSMVPVFDQQSAIDIANMRRN